MPTILSVVDPRSCHIILQYGRWASVMPIQGSVLKGAPGNPTLLNSVAAGFDCQAKRSSFEFDTQGNVPPAK
jgi:hypothetical protein